MTGIKKKSQIKAHDLFKSDCLQDMHDEYELMVQGRLQEIESYLANFNHDLNLMEKKICSFGFLDKERIEYSINHSYIIVWDKDKINAKYIAPSQDIDGWEKRLIECSLENRLTIYPKLQDFYKYVMDFLINNKLKI
jgi:hypothetical protein